MSEVGAGLEIAKGIRKAVLLPTVVDVHLEL